MKGLVKEHVKDPWACTMVWGLTMELRGGLGIGGEVGKFGDNCSNINNKSLIKKPNHD